MSQPKITSLKKLLGTEILHEDTETFRDEMEKAREVLKCVSVLLSYYGHPEDRFNLTDTNYGFPTLVEHVTSAMGVIIEDQVEVLAILQKKGVHLATASEPLLPAVASTNKTLKRRIGRTER